jgi:hypothetical protein
VELEMQEVELVLVTAPEVVLALAAGYRGHVAAAGLPPELARSSCEPWRSSLPKKLTYHIVGAELLAM